MISLRLLQETDKESFTQLMNRYVEEYVKTETIYPVHFDSHIGDVYWNHIQKDSDRFVGIVAQEEGILIGFCLGEIHVFDDLESVYLEGKKRGEVGELYVAPNYRNKKVGEQLVMRMEQECARRGCQHIILTGVNIKNVQAQRLYQRLNYMPWHMNYYKEIGITA